MLDGSHFFECKCYSAEHTLRFVMDYEEGIWINFYLTDYRSIWTRMKHAIRYILGRYHQFDETLLQDEDIERLRDLCNDYLSNRIKEINDSCK